MLRQWILLLLILFFAYVGERRSAASNWRPVTAQELKMTAAAIGDPEADAAMLFREGELNDTYPDGTSLKVYIRIKIFNDRGRRYSDIQLPYRVELGRITDVSARTVRPDGSIVEVAGRDIFDRIILRTNQGLWRAKVFSMPAVEAGSIIEYRYRQTYPDGFRYFQLDLQSELFTKELHYSIKPQLESKLDVRWVTFNAQDPRRFAPTWDGTFDIRAENIAPFRREPLMPPDLGVKMWGWLYYSNELETKPDKYWREYARRMYNRASYETKPTRIIRNVVDSITLSTDGAAEKTERLYNYVQKEIQNIRIKEDRGAEDEDDPDLKKNETVDDTIRRRYGTPRDINRLFIAMLRASGLDARVAELTTRDENFFHRSFPDSFQFNSEVTAVVGRDGSIQFYDPGTQHCPLGILSWEKEAATALLYDNREARFIETPVTDAARTTEDRSLAVAVSSEGRVDAQVDLKITGQRAIEYRNDLWGLNPDEQRKYMVSAVREVLPTSTINEPAISISNLKNSAAPLAASYGFTATQFATRTEKRLLLRPALLSHRDESLLQSPQRSNLVYFNYPWSESERAAITVPDGYGVEPLPDPIEIDIGAARYQARFARDGSRVIYERRLTVNAINFTVDQYQTVKAFFDRVLQADHTAISFRQ
jgi:transglutaminase-like putative cysteine protease